MILQRKNISTIIKYNTKKKDMKMMDKLEAVSSIVIPIVVVILTSIMSGIGKIIADKRSNEKQWKIQKEKSAVDIMYDNMLLIIINGITPLLICLVAIILGCAYVKNIIWFKMNVFRWIYLILCAGYHILLFVIMKVPKEKLYANKEICDKCIVTFYKSPIIFSFMIWGFTFWNKILTITTAIAFVFSIIYVILIPCFFSSNKNYKYEYAKVYLVNGKSFDDISLKDMCQRKNWIIATNNKIHKEYRFRVKDLDYIEYYKERK